MHAYKGRAGRWGRGDAPDGPCSTSKGARMLRARLPHLTRAGHLRRADGFMRARDLCRTEWGRVADEGMRALRGRNFLPTDYRISGIGCDAFPERVKNRLRRLAWGEGRAHARAVLHYHAARFLFRRRVQA